MYQVCKFNPVTDISEAIPGLATDLESAIKNGVVLDTGIDAQYNNVDDPALIRGRVRDAFAAVDMQRSVLAAGKIVQNSNTNVSTQTGVSQ